MRTLVRNVGHCCICQDRVMFLQGEKGIWMYLLVNFCSYEFTMTACCNDEWASSYWKKYYCVPYMSSVGKGLHHKEKLADY